MTDDTDDNKAAFHWELLKLLLQVAWADGQIKPSERRIILGLAGRLGASPEQIDELKLHLDGTTTLPAPNFDLLRSRGEEVMEAAEQLVIANDVYDDEENALLAQLHTIFRRSIRPPSA